eukprot:RCo023800
MPGCFREVESGFHPKTDKRSAGDSKGSANAVLSMQHCRRQLKGSRGKWRVDAKPSVTRNDTDIKERKDKDASKRDSSTQRERMLAPNMVTGCSVSFVGKPGKVSLLFVISSFLTAPLFLSTETPPKKNRTPVVDEYVGLGEETQPGTSIARNCG